MAVQIPFSIVQKGKTLDQQMAQQVARAEREAEASLRRQIAEQQKLARLSAKLDKDIAAERKKNIQLAKDWGAATLAAGTILAKAGADAVGAARESIASDKELLGVLNSTGKAAAGYKDELSALAGEIQKNSLFTDEAIQHTEALLLKFDKVGRDVVPRATQATADLAELMDGDLAGAAQAVGKALDGNISALERTTGKFTDSQKEQIEALFESGRAAEAQAIILGELESKVGGQAKLAREAAGGWKDLEVSAGELQETMGKLLLAIGDAGATGAMVGYLDTLRGGADAWQTAIDKQQALNIAIAAAHPEVSTNIEDWFTLGKGITGLVTGPFSAMLEFYKAIGSGDITSAPIKAFEALTVPLEQIATGGLRAFTNVEDTMGAAAKAQEDAKKAADDYTKSLLSNTDAADGAADAQAKLADTLRDTAGKLIDIQDKAAADSAAAWDTYFKDEKKAWDDHGKAVDKINADSAKEQAKIQKDLAKNLLDIDKDLTKDLTKIDKDLARDKAKLQRDTDKQIGRMVQDAARAEKQERRQRQIDAKGDQRLFDFEMRQLAAEGEFNAILAAKERRAIEKQIDAEKATEEQRANEDNRRVEIDRARQDARDRMAELEAEAEEQRQMRAEQAEEARAEAIEQAAEAEARRQEELAQALADEEANYQERLQALRDARDEKLATIEETKKEAIAKTAEELTAIEDLSKESWNKLQEVAASQGEDVGAAFAEGMNAGFAREQRIDAMMPGVAASSDSSRPSSRPGVQNRNQSISSSFRPGASAGFGSRPNTLGFANGGAFTVGGFGGTDSQLVQFMATPGERVSVTPAGRGGGQSIVINIPISATGPSADELARRLAARVRAVSEEVVSEFYNEVIVPFTNR